ncbi:superoxide dismutase [Candidatus Nucleicultrix amoebiphila]|jgi:Fe-Mn family superoxide dismutase|uniref:Superoxide dismutase n=1 Tax=Candidatus Nucleicultrix amoebiphila FS5 TaxID=1414854 RepID=A0A1W6N5Z9_9PROT|nr:superoxide dismutase [Candidatus Nucleicultrix amoebiphila]ARN85156.1 superoxide dismutase [Candidatus Nucleicultrix amoebiphila FS5]
MSFTLPPLPFEKSALEPHISANTLNFHYDKHHQAYVTNLNKLTEGTPLSSKSLEEVILESANNSERVGIFNNAAQVWNHTFYWNCLSPTGGGEPMSDVLALIERDFGSFEVFQEQFKNMAVSQFGSGWAWLVFDKGALKITKTSNADLPLAHGQVALLTCDVWEHAYYLDFQNRRPDYVDTFLKHLVNWEFVAKTLQKA